MSILKVENVSKNFGSTKVLKDIGFTLEAGDVLAIIGSSGSGKTTLLRCLNFLETPDSGKFYLDDELLYDAGEHKKLTDKELRAKRINFGLVFQQFNLFPQYNVLDNVTLAPRLRAKEEPDYKKNKKEINAQIEANAKDILERVGLSQKLKNYPCELSGGQQQRVSIARALALEPKILFFDEPTSALDPELTGENLKVIRKLADEHVTMVIVTHEMAFARDVANKVIFMSDGVIAEEGSPEDIFTNPKNPRTKQFLQRALENP